MNSRHGGIAIVVENAPRVISRSGLEVVSIVHRASRATPQVSVGAAVQRVLDSMPDPARVKHLRIEDSSRLEALPNLTRFPNLHEIEIRSSCVKDLDELWRLPRLRRLFVASAHTDDFRKFQSLRLEAFRAWRATAGSSAISVASLFLQRCDRLRYFAKSTVGVVMLESCHHVDLETLSSLRGVASLSVLGRKRLDDLHFVSRCRSLQHLTITATPLSKIDFDPLVRNRKLKAVFLAVRDRVIADLGARAPHLIVTNGGACFVGGVPQRDARAYFDEVSRIQRSALDR